MNHNFNKVIKAIENGKNFAIFIHISPDGDAVGSGLALKSLLESKNKNAYLCCDDELNFSTEFLNAVIEKDESIINNCDTLIYLDMSAAYRSGKYQEFVNDKKKKIINIDHHITQKDFASIIVRDSSMSSTAELIYELFLAMNANITPTVATYLYTGIASDTGCFVHQNTTPSCHIAVADLIQKGANIQLANYELFSKRPSDYMDIVKFAIKNMKVYGDKLTLLVVNEKQYKKFGKPDSFYFIDALVHYTTDILIIATEKQKNKVKLNMRSRQTSVQAICDKFGGGGHKNAAGAEVKDSLKNTIEKLKKLILK